MSNNNVVIIDSKIYHGLYRSIDEYRSSWQHCERVIDRMTEEADNHYSIIEQQAREILRLRRVNEQILVANDILGRKADEASESVARVNDECDVWMERAKVAQEENKTLNTRIDGLLKRIEGMRKQVEEHYAQSLTGRELTKYRLMLMMRERRPQTTDKLVARFIIVDFSETRYEIVVALYELLSEGKVTLIEDQWESVTNRT